jgi:hypothetical protein
MIFRPTWRSDKHIRIVFRIESAPVVLDDDQAGPEIPFDDHPDMAGTGVLADVGQRLLDDVHDLDFIGRL